MNSLFKPTRIKNLGLKNRFIRSATLDNLADFNGKVTDRQIELYETLARGGAGLLITGISYVHPSGQLATRQNAVYSNDFIPGLKRLTSAVHNHGAKIAMQLFHAGRESAKRLNSDQPACGPSILFSDSGSGNQYKALSESDLFSLIEAFGLAAHRAREAGFDAVQLHGAHGYLLNQFLSPLTNRRSDRWGGSLYNRLRLHREIAGSIRQAVGESYPLLIKFGIKDETAGGMDLKEGLRAAVQLEEMGFDCIEISQGHRGSGNDKIEFRTHIDSIDSEAYFAGWCEKVKQRSAIPVAIVGGLRSLSVIRRLVECGTADYVSLCRPLIREPDLINRWRSGQVERASCISCNQCLKLLRSTGLSCGQHQPVRSGPYSDRR